MPDSACKEFEHRPNSNSILRQLRQRQLAVADRERKRDY